MKTLSGGKKLKSEGAGGFRALIRARNPMTLSPSFGTQWL
jgi:hypothetical protein